MRLQSIFHRLRFEPWAILPTAYQSIVELVERADVRADMLDDIAGMFEQRNPMAMDNGIATIHVFGTLLQKSGAIERACGNTDYEEIRRDVDAAISAGARGILLDIDSPGGIVSGMVPAMSYVRAADVPVAAFVDGMACSAAYGIACAADHIVATPESTVGNIGTILPWVDTSRLEESEGVRREPITNQGASLKAIGYTGSLTPEQREFLQARADEFGAEFRAIVEYARRDAGLDPDVFRAGWYSAQSAGKMGLIDAIGYRETALAWLASKI